MTLQRLHGDSTETLRSLYRDSTEILQRLYRNSLEILQRLDRLDRDSIETVQRDSSEIPQRAYRYSCRDFTDTLQRHHTDSTEAPQTHRDSKDALQKLCRDFTKG